MQAVAVDFMRDQCLCSEPFQPPTPQPCRFSHHAASPTVRPLNARYSVPRAGTRILKAAAESLIPTTLELGGKSPNIFFSSVCDKDDEFFDKAVEGGAHSCGPRSACVSCVAPLLATHAARMIIL